MNAVIHWQASPCLSLDLWCHFVKRLFTEVEFSFSRTNLDCIDHNAPHTGLTATSLIPTISKTCAGAQIPHALSFNTSFPLSQRWKLNKQGFSTWNGDDTFQLWTLTRWRFLDSCHTTTRVHVYAFNKCSVQQNMCLTNTLTMLAIKWNVLWTMSCTQTQHYIYNDC